MSFNPSPDERVMLWYGLFLWVGTLTTFGIAVYLRSLHQ